MTIADLLQSIESDVDSGGLFTEIAADYLRATRSADGPVSTMRTPGELARLFAEPLPERGRPIEEVVRRVRDEIIPECNHLYHPRCVGHQVSAPLPAAVWMESVTAALNQSVAVWEMSPVATVLETHIVRGLCELVGWDAVTGAPGGTLTTGGTEATFAALLAARSVAMPDVWTEGVAAAGPAAPVIVSGEHAHYAVTRAAGQMGLGLNNVVVVPSREWRMDIAELRATLDRLHGEGRTVMAVVATAGSTATGSFDDLEAVAALCRQRELWLHVDAAHGGSALLSEVHRHRLAGIQRAQSVAWDPHKMMLLPLQAGLVLVRDERALERAFAQRAPYLFHPGEDERVWDQGIRSFLCSRRADVFKLWVALQRYGTRGIGALYDHLCDTARALYDMVRGRPGWTAVHEPESNILCFRWVGDGTRDERSTDELNRALRERFNRSGVGWITTTILGGRRVLRATIMNPRTTPRHLAEILEELDRVARELAHG